MQIHEIEEVFAILVRFSICIPIRVKAYVIGHQGVHLRFHLPEFHLHCNTAKRYVKCSTSSH